MGIVALAGCDASDSGADTDRGPGLVEEDNALTPDDRGETVRFNLEVGDDGRFVCSATAHCATGILYDPETFNPAPALVTELQCGFASLELSREALLAYHSTLRCYDGGEPSDPGTWSPPGGIPFTDDDAFHRFFARDLSGMGDVFTSSAYMLAPMAPYQFCHLEGWGLVRPSGPGDGPREVVHAQGSTAVEFQAVVTVTANAGATGPRYDCHGAKPAGPGGAVEAALTHATRRILTSVTHDLPDEPRKFALPVVHDIAWTDQRLMIHRDIAHTGLRLRYVIGSRFPEEAAATPSPFHDRDLWVYYPGTTTPADMRGDKSCVEVDPWDGTVERIIIQVTDRATYLPLGAVVIERGDDDDPFECERIAPGGPCQLHPPEIGCLQQ